MKTLELHEEFEMIVLDEMRKIKILDHLIFGGGTMLRLCFDLPRYSVDLDFYLKKDRRSFLSFAKRLTAAFEKMGAQVTDEHEKHFSFLWELRMAPYPRRLKIEVRKDHSGQGQAKRTELNIAHSPHLSLQVRLCTLTLAQMWQNKIGALLDRHAIRDAYDLEFLTRRQAGDLGRLNPKTLEQLSVRLDSFSNADFQVKLGGILDGPERRLVLSNRFGYLKSKIAAARDNYQSALPHL